MWERTKIWNSGQQPLQPVQPPTICIHCGLCPPSSNISHQPSDQLPALPMYFVNWEVRVGAGQSPLPTPELVLLWRQSPLPTPELVLSWRHHNQSWRWTERLYLILSKKRPDWVVSRMILLVFTFTPWLWLVYSYTALYHTVLVAAWPGLTVVVPRTPPDYPGHYITLWCHPNPTVQSSLEQRHEDCAYLFW